MTTLEMIELLSSKTNEDGELSMEYTLQNKQHRRWIITWRPIRYPLEDAIKYLIGCKNFDEGLSYMCNVAREKY